MKQNNLREQLTHAGSYLAAAVKALVLAVAIGLSCGAMGAGFHHLIDYATQARTDHSWLLWLLPVGGVVTLLLYRLCKVSFGAGTNLILTSVRTNEPVPPLLAPLIVVGTSLSHLLGASVGREGAALQLGGSVGHNVGKVLKLEDSQVKVCAMCGMAACFSAMFGTPLAAAVFVVEVIRVGTMGYHALLPCLAASCCAHLTALALGAHGMAFDLPGLPDTDWLTLAEVAALAALCAVLGMALCVALREGHHLAERVIPNAYVRIAVGGTLMAVTVGALGLYDYAGAGTQVIARAMAGQADPWAFAVKLVLTALCVSAGFRGGEIVPTLFIGATFGCVVGPLLGLDGGFAAGIGMVSLFCAAVNCPMASLLLAAELFATHELVFFAVAVAVAFALSGRFSLYSSQIYSLDWD